MEHLHAEVWIFLVINSCHQKTQMLPEGSSSQVERGVPQNCMQFRGGLTEIDALFCDVLAALRFLLLLDGLAPSFHMAFVFVMPPSKRFFWPVLIDRLAPSSPPTIS